MSTNVVSMATHGIDLDSTNYEVEEHEVWSCRSESDCQAQYETLYDLVSHMRNVHPACTITCQVNGCEQEFSTASVWYWHVRRNHITLYTTRKRRSNTFAVKTMECPEEDDDQSQFGMSSIINTDFNKFMNISRCESCAEIASL